MKMFGISSLDDLPELPRYKLDENEQIVIDDVLNENEVKLENSEKTIINNDINIDSEKKDIEAPMPV